MINIQFRFCSIYIIWEKHERLGLKQRIRKLMYTNYLHLEAEYNNHTGTSYFRLSFKGIWPSRC